MVQYIDKSALLAEIERLVNNYDKALDYEAALEDVRNFIDSIQEEPKKCMYTKDNYTDNDRKTLCDGCEEKCEYAQKEEPVSEDFEAELDKYIKDNFTIDKEQLDRFGIEEKDYMYSMDKSDMEKMVRYFTGNYKIPVSDYLEEAAKLYVSDSLCITGEEDWDDAAIEALNAYKSGANWQKQQFEKNRLTHCDAQTEKEAEPVSEELGDYINELFKQFPEVSFAKLSRIAVRVSRWQRNQDVKNKLPKVINRTDLDEYAYQCAYDMSNDWAIANPTWHDVEDACKLGANWQKEKEYTCYEEAFEDGAKWKVGNLWKTADGDDLPEIDREVIALLDNGKVVFAHRPPEYWDGKDITTGKVTRNYPKTYDKGGWNIPDVKYWLDVELPKEIEL